MPSHRVPAAPIEGGRRIRRIDSPTGQCLDESGRSTLSTTGPSHDITASYRDGIPEVRVTEPQAESSASVIPVERA
jgi:hypothetical protein